MRDLTPEPSTEPGYVELIKVPDLSAGLYRLAAGAVDAQSPHTEDEVYVVTRGRAVLRTPEGDASARPGSILYVPAGEEHRFVDITEDFEVVVVFAPAEYSRRQP